jgi:general secretion pathway protein B
MSYILDALRRAEAQRARGAVPGLHGQSPAGTQGLRVSATRGTSWLAVAVVVLSLLLVATIGLAWWWLGRAVVPPGPMSSATPGPVAMAPGTVTQGPQAQASAAPAPAVTPARTSPGAASAPPADQPALRRPPAAAPAAPRRPDAVPTQPAVAPRPEATRREQPARPLAATVEPTAPTAPNALPRRSELPAELQRELPALSLGGTVYSSDAGQRMVVLNGEVWREGDRPAPGVTVSEVRRKDVVLSYKGQRFVLGP